MTRILKNCSFFSKNIDYSSHVISPGKLSVSAKTTEAVKAFMYPNRVSKLRSFLRACDVYQRFVPNFARPASSLNKKFKERDPLQFDINREDLKAVDVLDKKLTTPPVLALSGSNGQYIIDTDAHDTQVGFVLLQEQKVKILKPISYCSSPHCDAECHFDTTHE